MGSGRVSVVLGVVLVLFGSVLAALPAVDPPSDPAAGGKEAAGAAPAPAAPDTVAPAPGASAAGASLPAVLEEYRGLRVGEAYEASGKEFHNGHLRLVFRAGTIQSILTRSGAEAGFIYTGEGHYSYTTEDPGDRQTIERNIRAFNSTKACKDGTLDEEMNGVILVSSSPLIPEILGPAPKPTPAISGGARLAALAAELDDASMGLDHMAAAAILGARSGRWIFAQIDGHSVDPGYSYDPMNGRQESLWMFRNVQGQRFGSMVSRQFIEGGWAHSPAVVTRLDYSLETANNKDGDVKIAETIELKEPVGRVLPFILINHADPGAKSWKTTKKTLDVRSVKASDGKDLPFSHRYHELLVQLPDGARPGTPLTLSFDLGMHFLDTEGDEYYMVGGGTSFPEPQWMSSVSATSHWKVKTKKPYRAFTGGTIVDRREEGDVMLLESEVDTPSDEPTMIAGKFTTKETDRNGIKVRVNIYGPGSSRAFESYREMAYTLLDVYSKALSPYPRKELDILELKITGWYRSMPGVVLCSTEPPIADLVDDSISSNRLIQQFTGTGATISEGSAPQLARGAAGATARSGVGSSVLESRKGDWQTRAFMHELAHQWFGNLVRPRDYVDHWIAESTAEYLSLLVYAAGIKDPKDQSVKTQYVLDRWHLFADLSRSSASIAQANALRGEWTEGRERIYLLYGKGPLVVRMLHKMMGEDRFFALLENVVKKYAGKSISTDEFAREASAAAGQDLKWFFDQWIGQPGYPDLDVSRSIFQEGGKSWLTGRMKQRDPSAFKRLWIPFVFDLPGGQRGVKLVDMTKAEQDFRIELPAGAANVVIDPGKNNLVAYH